MSFEDFIDKLIDSPAFIKLVKQDDPTESDIDEALKQAAKEVKHGQTD